MRSLGWAALSALTLAVWLMLDGAAIGEVQVLVLTALVLALLNLSPADPRQCGEIDTFGGRCRLRKGHEGLHRLGVR